MRSAICYWRHDLQRIKSQQKNTSVGYSFLLKYLILLINVLDVHRTSQKDVMIHYLVQEYKMTFGVVRGKQQKMIWVSWEEISTSGVYSARA